MPTTEPTNTELMSRIDRVDSRFMNRINEVNSNLSNSILETNNNLNDLIDFLKEHMVTKEEFNNRKIEVDKRFDALEPRFGKLNHDLRDYIDQKIYDLRGDLVQIGVLKKI